MLKIVLKYLVVITCLIAFHTHLALSQTNIQYSRISYRENLSVDSVNAYDTTATIPMLRGALKGVLYIRVDSLHCGPTYPSLKAWAQFADSTGLWSNNGSMFGPDTIFDTIRAGARYHFDISSIMIPAWAMRIIFSEGWADTKDTLLIKTDFVQQ